MANRHRYHQYTLASRDPRRLANVSALDDLLNRHIVLEKGEEAELARRMKAGDREAEDRFARGYIAFVVKIVRDDCGHFKLAMDEKVSAGLGGLVTAMRKYDPDRERAFTTMASYWVYQSIQRAALNHADGRPARIPSYLIEAERKIRRKMAEMRAAGLEPTVADACRALGLRDMTERLRRLRDSIMDLDPIEFAGRANGHAVDRAIMDHRPGPAEQAEAKESIERLEEAVRRLPGRERQAIRMFFGLGTGPEKTKKEIGGHFGRSRERGRQLVNQGLDCLRRDAEGGLISCS